MDTLNSPFRVSISSPPTVVRIIICHVIIVRAPLHLKADELAKLNFQGLDLIFRSIRVQIRIPRGQIGQTQAFAYFQTRSFFTVARACARGCRPSQRKSRYFCMVVKKCALFFRALLYSDRVSQATMASPWATLIAACSSRSPLSFTPEKNIHSGGPRNKKCTSSTSKCLSVWAKNILGSSLMMAHDGHMGQTAYRCIRHGAG
jgi:hypothetical protein